MLFAAFVLAVAGQTSDSDAGATTPPAIATWVWPDAIWLAAIAIDCRPDEQNRLIDKPAVVIGSFDNTTASRAILPSCSPE